MFRIYKLVEDNGVCPVDEWIGTIRDKATRARILRRIDKIERGSFGDHKFFDGIGELRMDFGPGYRVYFAKVGNLIVLVLGSGDKKTQQSDIDAAIQSLNAWKKQGEPIELLPHWSDQTDETTTEVESTSDE